ncbi:MAG TPA: four helix bundle protein [Gemmatimonadales bacterium]|nr:four helix bundle protein [Gemmatimonadales bacterium]
MPLKANARRLRVHELACELAADAARLARTFRGPGSYERGDQLVRAALSISSNIAEACGRGSVREFRQFLLYARGSAQESITHLRVAAALDHAHHRTISALEARVVLISKMISRLHAHPPPDR